MRRLLVLSVVLVGGVVVVAVVVPGFARHSTRQVCMENCTPVSFTRDGTEWWRDRYGNECTAQQKFGGEAWSGPLCPSSAPEPLCRARGGEVVPVPGQSWVLGCRGEDGYFNATWPDPRAPVKRQPGETWVYRVRFDRLGHEDRRQETWVTTYSDGFIGCSRGDGWMAYMYPRHTRIDLLGGQGTVVFAQARREKPGLWSIYWGESGSHLAGSARRVTLDRWDGYRGKQLAGHTEGPNGPEAWASFLAFCS